MFPALKEMHKMNTAEEKGFKEKKSLYVWEPALIERYYVRDSKETAF